MRDFQGGILLDSIPKEDTIFDLSELFKIFSDPTRIKVLFAIKDQELCVCEISKILNMQHSAISHQLKILRHYKVVKSRREGRKMFYSLKDNHIFDILNIGLIHIVLD